MILCLFIRMITGEFVGLMFHETISTEIRSYFETVLSRYSVFMAQQGTPTVRDFHFLSLNEYLFA